MFRYAAPVIAAGLFLSAPALADTPQAPGVTIVRADFGVFQEVGGKVGFRPSAVVDVAQSKDYGWAIVVRTDKTTLHFRETLTLPSPAKIWDSDANTKVNADKTVGVTEMDVAPREGIIFHTWGVAPDDPKGHYVMRVAIDNLPERVFEFDLK